MCGSAGRVSSADSLAFKQTYDEMISTTGVRAFRAD